MFTALPVIIGWIEKPGFGMRATRLPECGDFNLDKARLIFQILIKYPAGYLF